MTPAVCLQGVQVSAAGRLLLDVPWLEIAAGERVAVVGPNGAGKSTLLKLIGGQVAAQQGRVEVLGRLTSGPGAGAGWTAGVALGAVERQALRRDTGLLMQGLHLVPRLTARENVLIGALGRLHGLDAWRSLLRWYPRSLIDEADAALGALGLADRFAARADRLSGGERQKVALARLQMQRPHLVLADEPTSALDPAATAQVCDALVAAAGGPGQTLLTVVHDLDLLPRLAARVLGMGAGRVRWDLPIDDVTPRHLQALYGPSADGPRGTVATSQPPRACLARA